MANKPDVRVRLSAEGVDDVVKAFKQVQSESSNTAKLISKLGTALGALSFGAAVVGLKSFISSNVDAIDRIGKMQEITGLSAETLQVYSFAAKKAHLDNDALNGGLEKAGRFFGELNSGAQGAKDTIQKLFGDPNALKGLGDDAKLKRITDALGALPDGFRKAALAQQIFGRSGAELIPTLNSLAGDGLPKTTAEAKKFGAVLTESDIEAARQLNDQMDALEIQVSGLAKSFTVGLAPSLVTSANVLSDLLTNTQGGVKDLGTDLGVFITAFVIGVVKVFNFLDKLAAHVTAGITGAIVLLQTRSLQQAADAVNSVLDQQEHDAEARLARLDTLLNQQGSAGVPGTPAKRPVNTGQNDDLELQRRLAKDRLALAQAESDNARAIQKAQADALQADEQAQFAQGLISVQKFFADRQKIIEDATAAESASLKAQADELAKAPLEANQTRDARDKQVQELRTKALVVEINGQKEVADLIRERTKTELDSAKEVLNAQAAIASTEGRRFDASRLELAAQIAGLERLKGEADAAFQARKAALLAGGTANINFEQITQQGQQAFDALGQKQFDLQDQVLHGKLVQAQADQKLLELEKEQLPVLQQIAAAQLAAAEATGDPAKIQQAQEFQNKVTGLGQAVDTAGARLHDFQQSAESALSSDFLNFFTTGIQNAHGLGDAFAGLASSVISSLQQIITQMLLTLAIQKLLGAFGFPGIKKAAGGVAAAPGKAGGGPIRGPGTGTSDSIPAWLSHGEFVTRAAVVRQPGVLEFLDRLNRHGSSVLSGGRRRFAAGGLVELAAASGDTSGGRASLSIGLDEELLLKRIEKSPTFGRILISTVSRHRKGVSTALGKQSI
jgi:hypothetical protein